MTENIIQLSTRLKRSHDKVRCDHRRFNVNIHNGDVTCQDCNSPVSAAHALMVLAKHYERIDEQVQQAIRERDELKSYQAHLKAAKRVEKIWRGRMLPACPHCKKGIEADQFGHSQVWNPKKQAGRRVVE